MVLAVVESFVVLDVAFVVKLIALKKKWGKKHKKIIKNDVNVNDHTEYALWRENNCHD